MTPRPPTHREPTDEEMQCLPEGTLTLTGRNDKWIPSNRIGMEARLEFKHLYAVPITQGEAPTLHEPITHEAFNKVLRERDEARAEARESLRDKYAMAALTGFLASMQDPNEFQAFGQPEHAAITVYGYADAMLAARNQSIPHPPAE